ncbi:putative disease resistance protein RGA3 isoform X2 [Miscanthus floridulus]|uniref:putative disease resistance protein RGA3 isoform X2 n=1 Tax=Miscanthus floridulus TaxID=154761 RepID=UPI00345AE3D4
MLCLQLDLRFTWHLQRSADLTGAADATMEVAVSAARWVVGKALAPVTHGVLEAWAASAGLGPNVAALKAELLYARALLDNAHEREIRSPALKEMLHKLRQSAYDADDVLDELEYFRMQDELDGTHDAADVHAGGGCVHGLALNARHTARAVAAKLKPSSTSRGTIRGATSTARSSTTAQAVGKYLPCCTFASVHGNSHPGMLENPNASENQRRFLCWTSKVRQGGNTALAPKLKFNRVEISTKMMEIIEHLKHECAQVSNILNLEFVGTNRITKEDIAKKRPTTTSYIADNQLYGRDIQKDRVVRSIIHGDYFANNELVVLPIVGPGGIGKTTFTQQVYKDVKSHFEVPIWICVSLNFNASRLTKEAVKDILTIVGGEKKGNSGDQELIEQNLKGKRFLLVLDDMWECHEEEWKKLLAPFIKAGGKGNMVIVTTRFPKVANMVIQTVDCPIEMGRLEHKDFMRLFEACVFVDQKPWEGDTEKLFEIGEKIVSKLKGFPLAAKTVGRLLRDQPTLKHWNQVLQSKEWELEKDSNDIMPALKLSYDYLPFHLQQCFYYCALFPEDYEFGSKELVHLWIGLDIVHPCDSNGRIDDVGQSYLDDLVDHGFFKKNKRNDGRAYYVVHDLLHDLAVNISSFECLSICSSNVKSVHIRQDVRHLSIIIDNKDVMDIETLKYYKNDLIALGKKLKVENLRTVMVFGDQYGSFAKTFCDLFEKARALRAIYLSSYTTEDMLCNFSKLIHLRYLRITSETSLEINLPATISRLYHLKIIHNESWTCSVPSRHLSNLVNMQHFISSGILPGDIFNVGNLALLRELRFEAKKENNGFELKQLAQLQELDVLGIYNLEKVETKEEAAEAKLFMKTYLHKLTLHWDSGRLNKESAREEHVLESLKPCSNLVELVIRGHGGATCPSWLGADLSVKNLEFLRLDDVSWEKLPPLGVLWLINEHGDECQWSIPGQSFKNLKRLELVKIPKLKKWIVSGPHELFSELKVLVIKDCTELMELPFKHHIECEPEHEDHMTCFPKLEELEIADCPKLSSLPCIPWSSTTCSARITQVGSGLEKLVYEKNYKSEYGIRIEGKDDLDNAFWMVVGFHSLSELKELEVRRCPPLSLDHLQLLSSLKTLTICDTSNAFLLPEGDDCAGYQFPVEFLEIRQYGGSGEQLTRLLSCSPNLRYLGLENCEKLTGLGVANHQSTEAQAQFAQQQGTRGEEEVASAAALLLLPPQLQRLWISGCPKLVLCPDSIDGDTEAGGRGGLQGLPLQWLQISGCPRFLSLSSSSSSTPCFPFPASLEDLTLRGVEGMETLLPLSNLTSLTELSIYGFEDLRRGEGLRHLALGRLTKLSVFRTPNFFVVPEPSLPHELEFPPSSPKLQKLKVVVDDVAGLLAAPICAMLSCSLTELEFWGNKEVELERFTKHQEEAFQLLTSLETISFWECNKLQCLPAGLHRLPNLKILELLNCAAMQSLPKDGLPSSLQELRIQPSDRCQMWMTFQVQYNNWMSVGAEARS